MRVNVVLIALALVLLGAGVLCVVALDRSAQALLQEAEAAAAALPQDEAEANARLAAFAERWARTEPVWQFIAIHEDLEEISAALKEAQEALRLGDSTAAALACARLPAAIETVLRKEIPTPGNIF
ncbi:MAG: DUF4363 family protein [Candidatus Spyradocola sp.]|jgi:hypothetical protein